MPNLKQGFKKRIKPLYLRLRKLFPDVFWFVEYYRASKKVGDLIKESGAVFNKLIAESTNKKCLQIGVKEKYGAKFGSNWISVDLFDTREFIDFHYDIHDLKFDDEEFDVVVCISILEHIPYPEKAIRELHRVLKPGCAIWIQLPFNFPYHEAPKDYWRVTPDGLRIWMKDFSEILCDSTLWARTPLITNTFFYGTKCSRGKSCAGQDIRVA